jgi:hypothetical protein
MASDQEFLVSPPLPNDRDALVEFSEVVQRNLERLFNISHSHDILTAVPNAVDVEIGIPFVVNLEGTYYLYVRVSATELARVTLALV